ncbi:MAG: ATP-binding protein [Deltaproteobacteria bacterium]|nr:ATP-binding protein [Deltaproteobacteria bacterium]
MTELRHHGDIEVIIRNDGPEIPKINLGGIFTRLQPVRSPITNQSQSGLGLGLFLCRKIIHAHHGKIWAESGEGKGTEFHFTLPTSSAM